MGGKIISFSTISFVKALPDKAKQVWAEVEKITDPSKNMKIYRDRLQVSVPPMVPFLRKYYIIFINFVALYLKDLTFINDGNASKVQGDLVNIYKLRMMAKEVQEIVSLGGTVYNFERKTAVMNWLEKPNIETNINKLKQLATALEQALH